MKKDNIYRRVGCHEQLFGIQEMNLLQGKKNNMKALQMYNSKGMQLMILPDRAMDIASLTLGGINISFLSKTNLVHPAFFNEDRSRGFFRNFYAGFLTTCGLTYMGSPCSDEGEELGLHGLISNIPAEEVSSRVVWNEDEPILVASGLVKQAQVFGEHIVLKREIILYADKNELIINDSIENRGFTPVPFMLLYHMNYGYPFISPSCQIHIPSLEITPRDETSAADINMWNLIEDPDDYAEEQVYFHKMPIDKNGNANYLLINNELERAVQVTYPSESLKWLTQWKCKKSGEYVLGVEPGNCHVLGRKKAKENNELEFLKPFEEKHYTIKIKGFVNNKEISQLLKRGEH